MLQMQNQPSVFASPPKAFFFSFSVFCRSLLLRSPGRPMSPQADDVDFQL